MEIIPPEGKAQAKEGRTRQLKHNGQYSRLFQSVFCLDDFSPIGQMNRTSLFANHIASLVVSGFDIIFPEVSLVITLAVILGKGPLCTSLNVVSHLRDDSRQGRADPIGWGNLLCRWPLPIPFGGG